MRFLQSMCMPPTIRLLFFSYSDNLIHPPGTGFCSPKMHICTADSQRSIFRIFKQTASPDLLSGVWIHFRNLVGYNLHLLSLPSSGSPPSFRYLFRPLFQACIFHDQIFVYVIPIRPFSSGRSPGMPDRQRPLS